MCRFFLGIVVIQSAQCLVFIASFPCDVISVAVFIELESRCPELSQGGCSRHMLVEVVMGRRVRRSIEVFNNPDERILLSLEKPKVRCMKSS